MDQIREQWGLYLVMLGPILPAIALGLTVRIRPNPTLAAEQEAKPKASWIRRFFAWALDMHIQMPFLVLAYVGHTKATAAWGTAKGLAVAVILYGLWYLVGFLNRCALMGRTGYSLGHLFLGIRTVSDRSGEPIGIRRMYMREQAHYLDQILLGFLWPIFDPRRRTIADKLASTITVSAPAVRTRLIARRPA